MRLPKLFSRSSPRPPVRRGLARNIVRYGIRAVAVLVILFVVVVGAGIAVIITGPTEIGFIRDRVQSALQHTLGDAYTVAVDKAVVDVDPLLGLVVQVDGVSVSDAQNAVVAKAPSTRFAIDPLALLTLRVEISAIEVATPEVSLVRAGTGEIYLGNSGTVRAAGGKRPGWTTAAATGPDGGFPDLLAALQILDRGIEPSVDAAVRAGFNRLTVVDGSIDVWDAARATQRRFPSTDLAVGVDPLSGKLNVSFASSGYGGRWTATFDREVDRVSGGRTLSGVFSQLTLADIFPPLGDATGRFSTDIPLYGRATVHFSADGSVEDASVRLDLGAGNITFGENHETVLLDEATVKLRWDVANRTLVVDPSPFYFGPTHGIVTGWIKPDGAPDSRRYAFDFEAPGAVLAPRDASGPAAVAGRISLAGSIDFTGKQFKIDNAIIQTPGGSLSAAGAMTYGTPDATAALAASFSPMDVQSLKQMWIPFIASGARRWVMAHITGGRVAEGRFAAAVPTSVLLERQPGVALTEDQLRLDLRLEDMSFTTFGELPEIRHASGNAVLAGGTFGLDVDGAEIMVPSGETVAITAGAFAIADVFARPSEGNIALQLSGDAASVGAIANAKPFLALSKRDLVPSDLSGSADVAVSMKLPLEKDVAESEIDWKVVINGTGLASKAPVEGRSLSDGDLVISVTPDDISFKGKATIDGVPADVSYSQPMQPGEAGARPGAQYARFTLDADARKRLGIGLDEVLGGTVQATLRNIEDGSAGQHYDLDLKKARVVMPGLGWSKGIGVPATLSFDMKPAPNGFLVDNIVMAGTGFGLTGTAHLNADYGLVSANIDQFSLRPGDSASFTLARTKTGYAIVARGQSFDMRGFITYVSDGAQSGDTSPDLTVDARFDRLVGFNQETIAGARLTLVSTKGAVGRATFSGSLAGSPVSIDYRDQPSGASLAASAADAGRVFRFADLYSRVSGGTIRATGQRTGASGPLAGALEVDNFDVVDEPALKGVGAAPRGTESAAIVDPRSVHFDRALIKFRKTGSSIAIDDGVLRGAIVGATFNGRYDFDAARVQINGTYVPAYALNNSFSRIPLIGLVLSGGASEGLFGVTFRVSGPVTQPQVMINPLSAVAPGIFRKIFEFH